MKIFIMSALALSLLASCGTRLTIHPNPHVVNTPQGPVTCLLYDEKIEWWDEAVSRPASMPNWEAQKICNDLGHKLANNVREVY